MERNVGSFLVLAGIAIAVVELTVLGCLFRR
jgi:hypothetical protein